MTDTKKQTADTAAPGSPSGSYAGRQREKQTHWSVVAGDRLAHALITVGGIGTIVAVSLVFVFLAWVAFPLFFPPATLSTDTEYEHAMLGEQQQLLGLAVDEYKTMGWALYDDGKLIVFRISNGDTIEEQQLTSGKRITAASFSIGGQDVVLGFDDGTIQLGTIGFETKFLSKQETPGTLSDLAVGGEAVLERGIVQRTPQLQFRLQQVAAQLKPPVALAAAAIQILDHVPFDLNAASFGAREYTCAAYTADEELLYCRITEEENQFTGQSSLEVEKKPIEVTHQDGIAASHLLVSGRGDNVFLAFPSGKLLRFDTRKLQAIGLAESRDLLRDTNAKLTLCEFLLGRETIICGDSHGGLRGWFRVRDAKADTSDQYRLEFVHDLSGEEVAITALGSSQRTRLLAVGYADGKVRVFQVTTERQIVATNLSSNESVAKVMIAPKDDGLVAMTADEFRVWDFDPKYPEATLASLFMPVWYEGYAAPIHKWESSSADVDAEMKIGLWPLVFGTLKATFYCILFGAPLALLAAIYTSEFAHPRFRAQIKPIVEMMASLPSVVLGFLAAIVFAPIVEKVVPATLASLIVVPVLFLVGAFLWQLMPQRLLLRLSSYRLLFICAVLPIGVYVSVIAGPLVERWFFAGDVKRWLDGQIGDGTGAWMFLWLPCAALVMWGVVGWPANGWLRRNFSNWTRRQFALLNLAKFAVALLLTWLLAYAVSNACSRLGFDPRGTYVDTYVQRNALVVGFVMGFAVIPIIFTIADDALSTVPTHLRSASLGAGATQWQTAVRIVIPTAMSGLFSALMIGLGRAVGETMIVLMAGGNTPVTEWNIFNGFRTLAANIAVELPEAVRNSTHYRTLFLAALTLFMMTFVINTCAEVVRQRFRRRAYQL